MGMLDWLFHRNREQMDSQTTARIDDAIKRILAMNPRLQMARHFRERLASAVATSLHYIDALSASVPGARLANASAWSSDPCIRAFFAAPEDLAKTFGHSDALREHFEQNPDAQEAFAVLSMTMIERHVLGVAVEEDRVRHDVAQTTLWFSNHRVRICGRTEAELREEINRRMVDQLAMEGLAKLSTDRRKLLAHSRELLQERVELLARQGAGIRSVVSDSVLAEPDELARVQEQIEQNTRSLAALRVPTKEIELELDGICEVMSGPASHLYVSERRICIDLLNVVQENVGPASHEIEFHFARIPGDPPETRAFALVCFPRTELLPGGLNIDAALRGL